MFDVTPVVEAIFSLLCVCITAVLIPYIRKKTTKEQQEQLEGWINIAVAAAEQLYKGSGRGEEKKKYVLNWLACRGVTVHSDKLDAMVEAAVYRLKDGIIVLEDEGE